MVDDRKKVGRPPSDTEAINLRLPREVIEELDELRRKEADVPTRPEMIRRIIQEFLKATKQNKSKPE
jgi:metal-responsive CopG/Arc/MetJ family transcriptional regulator